MIASVLAYYLARIRGIDAWLAAQLGGPEREIGLLFIIACTTVTWLVVTLCTRPVSPAHLEAFYRKVRPGGAWRPVADACGLAPTRIGRDLCMWVASTAMIAGSMFGLGAGLLQQGALTGICLVVAVAGALALWHLMRTEARQDRVESAP